MRQPAVDARARGSDVPGAPAAAALLVAAALLAAQPPRAAAQEAPLAVEQLPRPEHGAPAAAPAPVGPPPRTLTVPPLDVPHTAAARGPLPQLSRPARPAQPWFGGVAALPQLGRAPDPAPLRVPQTTAERDLCERGPSDPAAHGLDCSSTQLEALRRRAPAAPTPPAQDTGPAAGRTEPPEQGPGIPVPDAQTSGVVVLTPQ
jgi:hypothetical protein